MISSNSSYDDDLLNSAYANIGLIADRAWAADQDDSFRKLNHTLWVQNCKLTGTYQDCGYYRPRRVRDIIPGSWLARYGNYEYDEEREKIYKPDYNPPDARVADIYVSDVAEPWMLEEVEEHFARLNNRTSMLPENELPTTEDTLPLGTKWFGHSNWNNILQHSYPILKAVLPRKNTNRKDPTSTELCDTQATELYEKNIRPEDYEKYIPPRYTVDTVAEMHLEVRITCEIVRDLWNSMKSHEYLHPGARNQKREHCKTQQHQQVQYQKYTREQHQQPQTNQQQRLPCNILQQPLLLRPAHQASCCETIGLARRAVPPVLSAEVPEFFPKGPGQFANGHQEPLQFFPSSSERSYQDELFSYNRGCAPSNARKLYQNTSVPITSSTNTNNLMRSQQQWIQRSYHPLQLHVPVCPSQPLCPTVQPLCPTMVQRPLLVHEKFLSSSHLTSAPIPVYQRPSELYQDPSQRRKNHGVDFNNLILLTRNAMKARRTQSKNAQQNSIQVLESRRSSLKSETSVLQWLDKGYPKKSRELTPLDIASLELGNTESTCESGKSTLDELESRDTDAAMTAEDNTVIKFTKNEIPIKKRLYRDVLTNSSAGGPVLDNVFDKKYDELEQQAMEQYRISEECLALRYQELERQALEQYRKGDNSIGSTIGNRELASSKIIQHDQSQEVSDEECIGGHKCSGFGQCSPMKESSSKSEKGTPVPRRITILRPENKPGTSMAERSIIEKCSRPTAATKSLTKLNKKLCGDSKNTIKGASGDKIEKTVQALPKRRLILMSPLKKESGPRLMKMTDFKNTCSLRTIDGRASAVYRKTEVLETGDGDKKVTLERSSGEEGIRKHIILANEELMNGYPESLAVRFLEPARKDGFCLRTKRHQDGVQSLMNFLLSTISRRIAMNDRQNQKFPTGREQSENVKIYAICLMSSKSFVVKLALQLFWNEIFLECYHEKQSGKPLILIHHIPAGDGFVSKNLACDISYFSSKIFPRNNSRVFLVNIRITMGSVL